MFIFLIGVIIYYAYKNGNTRKGLEHVINSIGNYSHF
jgi:hypothetical protein